MNLKMMNPMMIPSFTENVGRTKKVSDLPTKLLESGIICLFGEIDEDSASAVIMSMLCCAQQFDEINLYINSPGGDCIQGFAIRDVIYNLKSKGVLVNTVGLGECASMGAYLLSCGTGTRRLSPNTRYMIHSVQSAMSYSSYPDAKLKFEETTFVQNKMAADLVEFSRGKLNKRSIKKLMQRDTFMSPQQAIDLGLADEITE